MRFRFLLAAALAVAGCTNLPSSSSAGAGAPVTVASLSGTKWVGVAPEGTDPRHLPRLEFVKEGRLSGFTGCNLMSGSWIAEGGSVRLGPIATTKRFCVGPEMDLEKKLLAALGDGARLSREGARLVLTGPSGARYEFIPGV